MGCNRSRSASKDGREHLLSLYRLRFLQGEGGRGLWARIGRRVGGGRAVAGSGPDEDYGWAASAAASWSVAASQASMAARAALRAWPWRAASSAIWEWSP